MDFNKNSFALNLLPEDIKKIIEGDFKKKGHKVEVKKKNLYLTVVPYWFCFYDIDQKDNGDYKHISGQVSLSALTNKIEDKLTSLFDYGNPKIVEKLTIPKIQKVEVKIKDKIVSREEAEKTISKVLTTKYSVDKENVALSGFVEIWIPFWKYKHDKKTIIIDGVVGIINNLRIIDKNQKTNSELFKELLEDVSNPKKLGDYIIYFFKNVYLGFKKIISFFIKNPKLFYLIVILILLYFVFFI